MKNHKKARPGLIDYMGRLRLGMPQIGPSPAQPAYSWNGPEYASARPMYTPV